MKKMFRNQKRYILLITIFAAIVLVFFFGNLLVPSKAAIDFSGTAIEYAVNDSAYRQERRFIWQGSYSGDEFEGALSVDGILEPGQGETVCINFSDGMGEPFFKGAYDHLNSTPANLAVVSEAENYAIISLYSQYRSDGDTVTAGFRFQDSRFVCIGDISRDRALDILTEIYS